MNYSLSAAIMHNRLSLKTEKAVLAQVLFVAIALLLPTITHRFGLNYKLIQPMHWMILFAGLTYGAVSGAVVGFCVPVLSFFLSGMPVLTALPLMIPELMIYGFVAGLLKGPLSSFGSTAVALVCGKLVYLLIAILFSSLSMPIMTYIIATWGPGLVAMFAMIVLLPIFSGFYIQWIKD